MRLRGSIVLGVLLLSAPPAGALDQWLQLDERTYPWGRYEDQLNLGIRLMADLRYQDDRLSATLVRLGPLVDVKRWLTLGFYGLAGMRLMEGQIAEEYRIEFEPELHGSLGTLDAVLRQRLEARWLGGTWVSPRYRWHVRLAWEGDPVVHPFVLGESVIALDEGFNQHRLGAGIGWRVARALRLDTWYMRRWLLTSSGWRGQNIILFGFQSGLAVEPAPD